MLSGSLPPVSDEAHSITRYHFGIFHMRQIIYTDQSA
jgi:hypothetical protein